MDKVYELVSGIVKLDKSREFHYLHETILLPLIEKYGVKRFFLSETFVGGDVGRFYNFYEYESWESYKITTELVLQDPGLNDYYQKINQCIIGTIQISIIQPMSYSPTY